MTTLYGIRNCDTIGKARAWLAANGVGYQFHDYRTAGVDEALLGEWAGRLGWESLLNRRGTTFRKLPDEARLALDETRAIALMREHPSLIRRPVLTQGATLLVGFDPARYEEALLA